MLRTAQNDRQTYGDVKTWVEEEPGSSGKDASAEIIRIMRGYPVRADKVTGDKIVRADPLAAQCEAGNVKLKKAVWNNVWLDELTSFPNGAHDDQVDSASGAFNKVVVPSAQLVDDPFKDW